MKLGISTASFFGKVPNENSIALLNEWGIPVCEVFLSTFCEYEDSFIDLLNSRKGNIEVHSVHSLTNQFEPQLFNKVDRTRFDALKYLEQLLKDGNRLGAGYYTFHGPTLLKRGATVPPAEAIAPYVADMISLGKKYGVNISYENVHWAYYSRPGFFKPLYDLLPDLYATLDIKQARQSEYDYKEYIKDMGSRISTVHICDYDENGKTAIPSRGVFNYRELFSVLKDNGYDGPVLIELYSKDYDTIDDVKRAYEYVYNIMNKV